MFRKSQIVLLLVAVLVSAFAVPVKTQSAEPVIAAAKCDQPGKLTMWVWDETWAKTLKESTDAWVANYCPGAEVEIVQQPWGQYWEVLRTNAAGGDLPDVFNMNQTFFFFYANNGVLLDLQPYWDEYGVDTNVWGAGLVDPYRWGENGDLYAAPVEWVTVAIYYNKDMFDAAGLDYPTPDWTWDDFAADAEKLTQPDQDIYGAAVYAGYQTGYPNWIASAGVTPIVDAGRTACTLGEPGSLEALNFLKGLLDKGYMPSPSIVGGVGGDDALNFWTSGKVAMLLGGAWRLPEAYQVDFNWDTVQMPKNPTTGRSRAILHAASYVASARTKNPDLAANLILYLASDEGQMFFATAGGVAPGNPSPEVQDVWIKSFDSLGSPKNIQAFVDATQDSQGVTIFDEIWNYFDTEFATNIFDLGMSVDDAVAQGCEVVQPYLAQQ